MICYMLHKITLPICTTCTRMYAVTTGARCSYGALMATQCSPRCTSRLCIHRHHRRPTAPPCKHRWCTCHFGCTGHHPCTAHPGRALRSGLFRVYIAGQCRAHRALGTRPLWPGQPRVQGLRVQTAGSLRGSFVSRSPLGSPKHLAAGTPEAQCISTSETRTP